jgi:hypothetical protein
MMERAADRDVDASSGREAHVEYLRAFTGAWRLCTHGVCALLWHIAELG